MATNPPARPTSRDDKATMGTSGDHNNGTGTSIGWMGMKNMGSKIRVKGAKERNTESSAGGHGDPVALTEVTSNDGLLSEEDGVTGAGRGAEGGVSANGVIAPGVVAYKVYKRRWFGLFQLALLNIIVSWDVSTFYCFFLYPVSSPALRVLVQLKHRCNSGSRMRRSVLPRRNTTMCQRTRSIG